MSEFNRSAKLEKKMRPFVCIIVALALAELAIASQDDASGVPPWQSTLREELIRAEDLGFIRGSYTVSGLHAHVPITLKMADIFDSVPKADLERFLKTLFLDHEDDDPDSSRWNFYLAECIWGIKWGRHSEPYSTGNGKELAIELYVPMYDPSTINEPNQPPQTTPVSAPR